MEVDLDFVENRRLVENWLDCFGPELVADADRALALSDRAARAPLIGLPAALSGLAQLMTGGASIMAAQPNPATNALGVLLEDAADHTALLAQYAQRMVTPSPHLA